MTKRIISVLLCFVVLCSSLCFSASAAREDYGSYKENMINYLMKYEEYWYDYYKDAFEQKGYYGYGTAEFVDLNFSGDPQFVVTFPCSDARDVCRLVYYYQPFDLYVAGGGDNGQYIFGYPGKDLKLYYDKEEAGFQWFSNSLCYISSDEWLKQNFTLDFSDDLIRLYYYSGEAMLDGKKQYFGETKGWGTLSYNQKAISRSKFDSINENMLENHIPATFKSKKINLSKWDSYTREEKEALLRESFDAFSPSSDLLPAPKISSYDFTSRGLKITWNKVPGCQYYIVYKKVGDTWKYCHNSYTNYTYVGKPEVGEKNTYAVRCVAAFQGGNYPVSPMSSSIDVKLLDKPQINKLSVVSNGMKIFWDKVDSATAYTVYVKSGDEWKKVGTTTSTSLVHKTAKAGKTYTYTVKCTSKDGKLARSYYDKNGTSISYLATPTLSKVENTKEGVKVTFKGVSGAENYRLYVKGGKYKSFTKVGDTTSTSIVDKNAQSGVKYTYTVACVNADGTQRTSAYNSTGKSITYIAAPVITKLGNAKDGVKITWDKVPGAAQYKVFVKSGSKWKSLGNTKSNEFVHKAAKSGETYTYTVRCVSSTGKSYTSAYDTVGKSIQFIATPKLSKVANTTDGVKVTWGAVEGASGYRVYVKGGEFKKWTTVGDTTETTLTHYSPKSGVKYTYTVACMSEDFKTRVSSFDSKGLAVNYIAAPVITGAKVDENGITISWDKVEGAQKYRVFVKSGSSWKKLKDTTSTSFTHNNLVDGNSYTYTVRCISSTGKSYTSAYNTTGVTYEYILYVPQQPPTEMETEPASQATEVIW